MWQVGVLSMGLVAGVSWSWAATPEENAERQRINQLKISDTPFEKLSHQTLSEWGQKALKIQEKQWKHAESEHFIIHYPLIDVRDRFIKEAEFYYWKIKNDLKVSQDLVDHKSHIYVFVDEAQWRQFQANTDVLQIGGVCLGNEYFCLYPKRREKESSGTAAHEMTHLVFNRFFVGNPPRWLNEGIAEYQARKAYFAYHGQRYESINKDTSALANIDFFKMTELTEYPQGSAARSAFYVESQLAVETLIEKGGPERFVAFVNTMIQNPDFKAGFDAHYLETFKDAGGFLKEMERKEKQIKYRH